MSTRGKWAEALPGFAVGLVIGAGLIYAGEQLDNASPAVLRLLGPGLWAFGLGAIGRAIRQLLGEVAPGLVARGRSWLAGRGSAIAASLFVVLLLTGGAVLFVGAAVDEHFLGAGGHEGALTRAMLLGLAGSCAAMAGYAGWQLARGLRTGTFPRVR